MPDILVAIDETTANSVVKKAIAAVPAGQTQGQKAMGSLSVSWNAVLAVGVGEGIVDLRPPEDNVIRLGRFRLHYELSGALKIDLSFLNFCLPRVCIKIWKLKICTPKICVYFPTISVPFTHTCSSDLAVDLRPEVKLTAGVWRVDAVVVGTPTLNLGLCTTGLIVALGAVVTAALAAIPILGPLLAVASATVLAIFTVANITGLLGQIVTPYVAGIRVELYSHPKALTVRPATNLDPAAAISIDAAACAIQNTGGEDELVLSFDISPL